MKLVQWLSAGAGVLVLAGLTLSCGKGSSTGSCGSTSDCRPGEVCDSGACKLVCYADSHCDTGEACVDGLCVPANTQPPVITGINGTGSTDGLPGHTPNRLVDRIVVTGLRFLGASAELIGPSPSTARLALAPCVPATNTELQLGLPTNLSQGDYTLSIFNQSGQACEGVQILKGEDGTLVNADPIYVNVDGDSMTGSLGIEGQLSVASSGSAASISARSTVSEPISGVVTATGADSTVSGVNTQFTNELTMGEALLIEGILYTVTGISNGTSLTVSPQPAAFLNVPAYRGGPVLELQDGAGDGQFTVDRLGRVGVGTSTPAYTLDVIGDVGVSGALACTACVNSTALADNTISGDDIADGAIANADISASAAIAASKINRAGLDADTVDGRQPTVPLYACPTSCQISSWASPCRTCTVTSTVSTTNSVPCTGYSNYDWSSGTCYTLTSATCSCPSLLGYLMNP